MQLSELPKPGDKIKARLTLGTGTCCAEVGSGVAWLKTVSLV